MVHSLRSALGRSSTQAIRAASGRVRSCPPSSPCSPSASPLETGFLRPSAWASSSRLPAPGHDRRSLHCSPARRAKVTEPQFDQIARIARQKTEERDALVASISETDTHSAAVKKAKRIRRLDPVAAAYAEYKELATSLSQSVPLLSDPDPSMRELARAEVDDLRTTLRTLLSTTIPTLLLPPSNDASLSCILELKAGAGGDEAALFADEIMVMYQNYARAQGWKVTAMALNKWGNGNGIRDAQIEIKGEGAYGKLRWESGVHRVQRVPATETKGRTHTSTIAVVCLPIDDNPDVEDLGYIDDKDVEMQFMRSSGAGGQHVNKTESAVRLTHKPTGIVVACQEGRSQHANRSTAWILLRAKIHAHRLAIQQEIDRANRKNQIPGMDRADKIRTWNFPQDRVTDHRVPINMSNLQTMLSGAQLDDLLDAVGEYQVGLRLEAMLGGDEYESDG